MKIILHRNPLGIEIRRGRALAMIAIGHWRIRHEGLRDLIRAR